MAAYLPLDDPLDWHLLDHFAHLVSVAIVSVAIVSVAIVSVAIVSVAIVSVAMHSK